MSSSPIVTHMCVLQAELGIEVSVPITLRCCRPTTNSTIPVQDETPHHAEQSINSSALNAGDFVLMQGFLVGLPSPMARQDLVVYMSTMTLLGRSS